MYHYEYVTKEQAGPYRKKFESLINEVQNLVRDDFTFSYKFIGSSSRNMITFDPTTNKGFDFDINIEINDSAENYTAKAIRMILINAFNKCTRKYDLKNVENGTRVLTIKKNEFRNIMSSRDSYIPYSCDIAVVNNYLDNGKKCQEYIRFNKNTGNYTWEQQKSPYEIEQKVEAIKDRGMWNQVRKLYLDKKNKNTDVNKKSRSLYAEAVKEIYDSIEK